MKRVKNHFDKMSAKVNQIKGLVEKWSPTSLTTKSVKQKIKILESQLEQVKENGYNDKAFLSIPIPVINGSCVVWNWVNK